MLDSLKERFAVSLTLLDALHQRWIALIKGMNVEDFARLSNHPQRGMITLDDMTALYAWHGTHHVAHITALRERMGWR